MDVLINGEIVLYGTVGAQLLPDVGFFTDVDVKKALSKHGKKDIGVRINSGGGWADNGVAIYNALKDHPGKVNVSVDGVAASAGSVIAMAGDTITMKTGALMMVHQAQRFTIGNADDHQKQIEALQQYDAAMADIYASRTGRPRAEIIAEMAAETWMSGTEAVAKKYATGTKAEPSARAAAFDYRQYAHAPDRMVALAKMLAGDWTPAAEKTPATMAANFWQFVTSHGKAVEALAASFDAQFKGHSAVASNVVFSEIWNAAQQSDRPAAADWVPSARQFAAIDPAAAVQAETIRREMADMAATCHMMGRPERVAAFITAGATQRAAYEQLQSEKVAADASEIRNHFPSAQALGESGGADPAAIAASWEKAVEKVNKQYGFTRR
ncbi:head maturation protease, ClpP-related [Mesorhizobium sp. CO1-1-9]|uniref:head maturation protease, ClpP-related n=1 Tax=Mesorhizobium sp. CO1-1-9 TaxID=2876630 RepID=UPI001CCEE1A5|nr:head maturation protease, ClpP-related [Mesorhizobium sp. CO1-1-9]MBZ9695503.1 Clp protease ClpP [Mesorhizobium sp. CO1-1-9]